MKLIISALVLSATLYANNTFEKNVQYICLNTHNIEQGVKVDADSQNAKNIPFVFTIKENKLVTSANIEFNYMMSNGNMISYSNAAYMLLLQENLNLGLVPKKSRGAVQFYFKCAKN